MVKHGCCSREERIIVAKSFSVALQLKNRIFVGNENPIAMSRRHSSHPENGFPFALKALGIPLPIAVHAIFLHPQKHGL
ncbi:MAG: hypothetical protein IKO65_09585 [Victivallales bacterium]|nr:hypothetical protein [Victivallales bacterium]